MHQLNYTIKSKYSLKNALLWGNFYGHAKAAKESGRWGDKIVHLLIAAVEACTPTFIKREKHKNTG
jgi:hypothetical protein